MSYTVGKTNAKKHCYAIYLRVHGVGALHSWLTSVVGVTEEDDLFVNDGTDGNNAEWADAAPAYVAGEFGKIGAIEEKPTITGSEGEEIGLASCDSHTVSEMIEGAFNNIEVTAANYLALRNLAANGAVDVLFYDLDEPTVSIGIRKVVLKVFPVIAGNDMNKIELSFKKEAGNLDDYFGIITVT